jgi:hypothetical protein
MFAGQLAKSGKSVNEWDHHREVTPIDAQNVIRMNRDTLYSIAVVDISKGATITMPDGGDRYVSLMVLNADHYINAIYHDAGTYTLTMQEFDTTYVAVVMRAFVDPNDPADVSAVHALQDQLVLTADSANPFVYPDYDEDSRAATQQALQSLGTHLPDAARFFGRKNQVDQTRHLIGTAVGWGGLPESEAYYVFVPEQPVGRYTLRLADVPCDAFWSVSVYNRDGFFEENPFHSYGANSVTATPDDDGSVTLHFAPDDDGSPNYVFVMEGWNYALRLYRPHPSVIDGTWKAPTLQPG